MKIVVTVKQVPDPNATLSLEGDNSIARDREVVLDPGDEYGVEEGPKGEGFQNAGSARNVAGGAVSDRQCYLYG